MGHDKGHEDSLLVYFLFVAIPPGLIFGALMCLKHWLLPFKPANAVKAKLKLFPAAFSRCRPARRRSSLKRCKASGPSPAQAASKRVSQGSCTSVGADRNRKLSLQHAATCNL